MSGILLNLPVNQTKAFIWKLSCVSLKLASSFKCALIRFLTGVLHVLSLKKETWIKNYTNASFSQQNRPFSVSISLLAWLSIYFNPTPSLNIYFILYPLEVSKASYNNRPDLQNLLLIKKWRDMKDIFFF